MKDFFTKIESEALMRECNVDQSTNFPSYQQIDNSQEFFQKHLKPYFDELEKLVNEELTDWYS